MALSSSVNGNTVTINISGRFDFNVHRDFRDAYKSSPKGSSYIINLAGTEYIDSSALGMLLLLREHTGSDHPDIRITNCKPEIRDILTIANFQKLFQIA